MAAKVTDRGRQPLSATALVARLQAVDKCPGRTIVTRMGNQAVSSWGLLSLRTWPACATGKRLAFAVWRGGGHAFPRPPVNTPAAAQVIWSFFTKTPLAPLP